MTNIFNYIDRPSPIHDLTGATKLVCLLLWSFAAMTTYDTRLLVLLVVLSLILFRISKIRLADVRFMLGFTAVFMLLNNILVFLFSPQHGVELYGTRHVLFSLGGNYVVTKEQLFYHLNLFLKYLASIPVVLLFAPPAFLLILLTARASRTGGSRSARTERRAAAPRRGSCRWRPG